MNLSKLVLIGALLILSIPCAFAQSVSSFYESNGVFSESNRGLASNSVWFGATPLINFHTSTNPQFEIHTAGQIVYTISDSGKITWPVRANLSKITSNINLDELDEDAIKAKVLELASSSDGATVGVYPYRSVLDKTGRFSVTLHGTAAWKLNAFKMNEEEEAQFLNQWRFSIGADFGFGDIEAGEKHRAIVSIAPVISFVDENDYEAIFGERKSNLLSLETVIILPIADRIGFSINHILAEEPANALRIGLILAADSK